MNEPLSRSQFKIKLREIAQRHKIDLKAENFSEELFDLVVVERVKILTQHKSLDEERRHVVHRD